MKKKNILRKILFFLLGMVLLVLFCWLIFYLVYYHFYNEYRDYKVKYTYEEGEDFTATIEGQGEVENMVLVSENDNLKLYANLDTAEIACYDKRNGEIIYSNPLHPEEDSLANETNRNYLKSQFILQYYNTARVLGTYDSYSMSVSRGQIEVERIKDGIRFLYTVGNFGTNQTGIVPIYLSKDKLEEIQSKLEEKDAATMGRYYKESETVSGMYELGGVAKKNAKMIEKLAKFLETAGFTEDDYKEQMELAGEIVSDVISFVIPMEYRLIEDGVLVSVPTRQIKENGGGKLYSIQLLRYLGAASNKEDGYFVVPNGSGSLIYFNNGKTSAPNYSQYVYGIDPLSADYEQVENTKNASLPLFGICRKESSILATIEDGASLSYIQAGVSGVFHDYNYVYPTFLLRGSDTLEMFGATGNEADVPILEKNFYDVNLTVRYTFLTKEDAGYSGMANFYRNRLMREGILTKKASGTEIPFYYDVIGGVKETAYFLGSQYLRVNDVTTFAEAEEISKDLYQNGITNQVMNFQGWCNGGYYHDVLNKIKVTKKLGGKKGLERLSKTVTSEGGRFYVDAAFQEVSFISKRYQCAYESSRYYGAGYIVYFGQVNPGNLRKTSGLGYEETMYHLISPKFLPRYIDKFTKSIMKYDIDGISLRDLGDELHSDRKRTNIIHREEALDVVTAQLSKIADTKKHVMVSCGNDYSFAYANDIINAPLCDNTFAIIDAEIPFYEMVLHGSIDYSGELMNFMDTDNEQKILLRFLEYGASPHYVFTQKSSNELKHTGLNRYYSTKYADWKEEAIKNYHKLNDVLQKVSGETINQHEILEENVRKITYSNKVTIYINYQEHEVTTDGVTIPALGYLVEGAE